MKEKQFIAYDGNCFTIEWYFDDKGDSQALNYFFTSDKKIIVTVGFQKKSNKLPTNIKNHSIKIKEHYLNKVKDGSYYSF